MTFCGAITHFGGRQDLIAVSMARSKQGVFLIGADCAVGAKIAKIALSNKRESSTIMLDNPSSSGSDSSSLLKMTQETEISAGRKSLMRSFFLS